MHITFVLDTQSGERHIACRVAHNFLSRAQGLLFHDPLIQNQGLLLENCRCIHTIGLSFCLDIIYLNTRLEIVKCISSLKPWHFSTCITAAHTLELAAGEIARLNISPGQQCHWLNNE